MRFSAFLLFVLFCGATANQGLQHRRALRAGTEQALDPELQLRLDGLGFAGSKVAQLLQNINNFASGVQRLGSDASSSTTADSSNFSQQRNTSAVLRTLPLSTTASSTSAVAAGPGSSSFTANSTSVAKDILDDNGGRNKSFGSSAISEGFSTAVGARPALNNKVVAATTGSATTAAGEKALRVLPLGFILDGGSSNSAIAQRGIGDNVLARLQAGTLSALSGGATEGGTAQSGGSFILATANSADGVKSVTADLNKQQNTAATLSTNSFTNRYGYSASNDAANIVVDSTQEGSSQIVGGRFATGNNFGTITTTTSTYPEQSG